VANPSSDNKSKEQAAAIHPCI